MGQKGRCKHGIIGGDQDTEQAFTRQGCKRLKRKTRLLLNHRNSFFPLRKLGLPITASRVDTSDRSAFHMPVPSDTMCHSGASVDAQMHD